MALVTKTDDRGNSIVFKRYQGRTFHEDTPANVGDHLKHIASLQYRPDDVLLCTFPKSVIGSGGSWFTHTREWKTAMLTNPDLKILFLRYEDLKKNLYRNIVRIADFLEIDHKVSFLKKVEVAVAFENLRKEHATFIGEREQWKHKGDNGRLPIYRKDESTEFKRR